MRRVEGSVAVEGAFIVARRVTPERIRQIASGRPALVLLARRAPVVCLDRWITWKRKRRMMNLSGCASRRRSRIGRDGDSAALRTHPDKGGSKEEFQAIVLAFEELQLAKPKPSSKLHTEVCSVYDVDRRRRIHLVCRNTSTLGEAEGNVPTVD